jgi:hypothetical protein
MSSLKVVQLNKALFGWAALTVSSASPSAALAKCVSLFLSSKRLSTSIVASYAGLQVVSRRGTRLSATDKLDEMVCLINRDDAPTIPGQSPEPLFLKADLRLLAEYNKIQELLLERAIVFLDDPTVTNHRKYLFAEQLIDEVPQSHPHHQTLQKIMDTIARNSPQDVHLCPYRHERMPWAEAMASIYTPGIPQEKSYGCLYGMWMLALEHTDPERAIRLHERMEVIREHNPGSNEFGLHIFYPLKPEEFGRGTRRLDLDA